MKIKLIQNFFMKNNFSFDCQIPNNIISKKKKIVYLLITNNELKKWKKDVYLNFNENEFFL